MPHSAPNPSEKDLGEKLPQKASACCNQLMGSQSMSQAPHTTTGLARPSHSSQPVAHPPGPGANPQPWECGERGPALR